MLCEFPHLSFSCPRSAAVPLQLAHRRLRAEPWLKPSPSSFVLSFVAVALVMRSASCRETSRATKPVRLSIQHRVQRLLDRSTNHLTKMIPDPRLINLDHLSIGFSSLIGCSFILEEAVNPERSRWRASVHRQADRRVHRTTSTMASRSGSSRPGPASAGYGGISRGSSSRTKSRKAARFGPSR